MKKPGVDLRLYLGTEPIKSTDGAKVPLTHPGDQRSPYDECGCIAPCPDHKSPAQDGRRDRDYWNDHHYPSEDTE